MRAYFIAASNFRCFGREGDVALRRNGHLSFAVENKEVNFKK